ncbi:hypothetical protein FPSE_01934 [Fusarium pseudograminearum CS3096]|uniref:Uncharacterized protein n=1 Tax=Fusarium pseudograminearum (strain CS3096) TaxID=1028729 RepID=K3UYI7_FUSPC|nr:hypothetical protein FPSE_01934 [Fusarium pseudograminearum CS3096]EKJ77841.1 hypothetical protein FPSE_01934 [Fusarium pseudograminearum CS3096]
MHSQVYIASGARPSYRNNKPALSARIERNLQGSFVHSWIWYPLFWQQRQAFFHNIHRDKTGSQDANGWDGSDDDDRDVRASRI